MFTAVALAAGDGSQLVAEGGGGGEILANRGGIGPWETFRLFNRSSPDSSPRHGDSIALQVHDGGFLTAPGDGRVHAAQDWIDAASVFTVERVAGPGTISSRETVALRAPDGRFLVAENNGGSAVNANRPRRGPWETFTITIMGEQLVRLRSSSGRYLTAERGGGREVTANRDAIGLWETFALVNFSRPDSRIHARNTVALKTWNGAYVQVDGRGGVNAAANQARDVSRFRVTASGVREIRHGHTVGFQSLATAKFLTDESGRVSAQSAVPTGSAGFTIELAEREGIGFGWIPDGAALAGRPFDPLPPPAPSPRDILTLHFFEHDTEATASSRRTDRRAARGRHSSCSSRTATCHRSTPEIGCASKAQPGCSSRRTPTAVPRKSVTPTVSVDTSGPAGQVAGREVRSTTPTPTTAPSCCHFSIAFGSAGCGRAT